VDSVEDLDLGQVLEALTPQEWSAVWKKVNKARDVYGKVMSWKGRVEQILALFDEDSRTKTLLELGNEGVTKLLESVLSGVSKHPYFSFHQEHLKILFEVIQASSSIESAEEWLKKAVRTAEDMNARSRDAAVEFDLNGPRFAALRDSYNQLYLCTAMTRSLFEAGAGDVKAYSTLLGVIRRYHAAAESDLGDLNALCGLLASERAVVSDAMKRYEERMAKLKGSSDFFTKNLSNIAAARNETRTALDLLQKTGGAYGDPLGLAKGAEGRVVTLTRKWAELADAQQAAILKLGEGA
jgi:hypothetical protein